MFETMTIARKILDFPCKFICLMNFCKQLKTFFPNLWGNVRVVPRFRTVHLLWLTTKVSQGTLNLYSLSAIWTSYSYTTKYDPTIFGSLKEWVERVDCHNNDSFHQLRTHAREKLTFATQPNPRRESFFQHLWQCFLELLQKKNHLFLPAAIASFEVI